MQTPIEKGNTYTRFSPAEVQGALPRLEIIMKLLPKALRVTENKNQNVCDDNLIETS